MTVGVDASLFAFFEVGASYINPGRNGNVETAVKTLAYVALFNSLSMLLSSRLLTVALEMSSCSPEEQIVNPTGEPTEDRPGCYRLRTWAKFVYFECERRWRSLGERALIQDTSIQGFSVPSRRYCARSPRPRLTPLLKSFPRRRLWSC